LDDSTNNTWVIKRIINPYEKIDFSTADFIPGISHEHCFTQKTLENAYNRGIRFFAISHYAPSAPFYPLSGYNSEYEDWEDFSAKKIVAKHNVGKFDDFFDKNGDVVKIQDLLAAPNAEKANFINSGAHITHPGSTYGSAINTNPNGNFPKNYSSLGDWRKSYPLPSQNIDTFITNVKQKMIYIDGGIIVVSHNQDSEEIKRWINLGCKGKEIYNNYFDENTNRNFLNTWDKLLNEGNKIWGFSVVDWQGVRLPDKGCNLIVANLKDYTNEMKEHECLKAYTNGQFFASWYGRLRVEELSSNPFSGQIIFRLSSTVNIKAKTNKRELEALATNVMIVNLLNNEFYIRFEATDGSDFLWTNPIFIE
jgi:hypothetical protein